MAARTFDLLVAGELNPDAILVGESIEPEYGQVERLVDDGALTVGSSGAIVACGAARLGMRTAYVGVVGDDAAGRFMLDELRGRGVDVDRCRVDPGRRTGLSVVLSSGEDRAILTSAGAMSSLTAADVGADALAAAEHLHVSSPHLQPGLRDGLAELFARARAAGTTTSLDPGWDPASAADGLDDVLAATDVFLPNAAEACRLTGAGDPDAALADLAARVPTVVVTLGADGAIARRGDEADAGRGSRGRSGRHHRRRGQPRGWPSLRPRARHGARGGPAPRRRLWIPFHQRARGRRRAAGSRRGAGARRAR